MPGVKLADGKQRPHFGDSRQYYVPVTFSPSHLQPESPQGGGDPAAQTFLPNAKALLSSPCLGFPRLRLICRRRLFQRICLPSFSPSPTAPASAPPLSPSNNLMNVYISTYLCSHHPHKDIKKLPALRRLLYAPSQSVSS